MEEQLIDQRAGQEQVGQGIAAPPPVAEFVAQATICNINHIPTPLQMRTYTGPYLLNYPEEGQDYALTFISWKTGYMDRGDFNPLMPQTRSEYLISAKDIAADLCREINDNIVGMRGGGADGGSFWGVFVCEGLRPTPEEVRRNKSKFDAVLRNLVQMGDMDWARYHKYELVADTCRMAAKILKLNKEWAYNALVTREACPACGMDLPRADVAICAHCRAVLNREAAVRFGLIPAEAVEEDVLRQEQAELERIKKKRGQ